MIIVGLFVLAAVAVGAVEVILANDGPTIPFHMWRWTWQIDAFWLVVGGAAALAAALLGLAMVKSGSGRSRRLRRERRELAKENRRLAERAEIAEAADQTPAEHAPVEYAPAEHAPVEYAPAEHAPVEPTLPYSQSDAPRAATKAEYVAPAGEPAAGEHRAEQRT